MATALRSSWHSVLTTAVVALSLLTHGTKASAAEPTEAERMYDRLRETETHKDKLLAERWHKLVRQRQWVDLTGKHKTYARYVDHDPNLKWVKLSILVKKGAESTYKESSVPVARLSKTDQAVVKRIAMLREQVETALAEAPAGDLAGEERGAFGEQTPADPRARMGEEAPVEAEAPAEVPPPPAKLAALAAIDPWRTDFAAFTANLSPQQDEQGNWIVTWTGLPAFADVYRQERQIHQLKAQAGAAQPRAGAEEAAALEQPGAAPPADADPEAQRRANAFGGGPRNEFLEEPAPVEAPAEVAAQAGPPVNVPGSMLFMLGAQCGWSRSGLGEVSWETTIQSLPSSPREPLAHDLQLPSPITLELVPDAAHAAEFARLKPGQRIRIVGRFERLGGLDDQPKIVLKVRPVSGSETATTSATATGSREEAPAASTPSDRSQESGSRGVTPDGRPAFGTR
jgi:hypothetical protein